ncbi:MAG: hypothetical protein Q9187_006456, partial [Circinaria calcarea]
AEDLVPGDIVQLGIGDIVAADLRLASGINLSCDEALLTGESSPSAKNADFISDKLATAVGDRVNIAYSSTTVTRGRGAGIVVATGMDTDIGRIALFLYDKKGPSEVLWYSQVDKRASHGVRNARGLKGTPLQNNLHGSKAMAKSNVIVRNIGALEAIGGVTNIYSDKTGTFTQGKMMARRVFFTSGRRLQVHNESNSLNPTTVMAMRAGASKFDIIARDDMKLLTEHSFDSAVKRMSVVYQVGQAAEVICCTKGATEALIPQMFIDNATSKMIVAQADAMASEGLRVLCLAHRTLAQDSVNCISDRKYNEQQQTFADLIGIYDPPRQETSGAIRQCQGAGITVHMLTGDRLKTATKVAREVGILTPYVADSTSSNAVMTASIFDKMTDAQLDELRFLPLVLARASSLMTGDGVNDSPALKGADVGVVMGSNGSDVSKEAANIVLTDNNFASIVSAIREGRRLFDNIRKFLLHLLISNIAQVVLLLVGLAFEDSNGVSVFPLSPLEILFPTS